MNTNHEILRGGSSEPEDSVSDRSAPVIAGSFPVANRAAGDLIDEATLASRLGVSRATLQSWRYAGRGPTYIKVGRFIRYRNSDVEAFLNRNARAFTR